MIFGGFVRGQTYNRGKDVHGRFGGQQQGGIATPGHHPVVFAFTGLSGEKHGYGDTLEPDGVIRYFGEGQLGPMTFVRGNKAIRDHVQNDKALLLFQALGKGGQIRFLGEYVCSGYETQQAPDTAGNQREAIVFHLVPLGDAGETLEPPSAAPSPGLSLADLRKLAMKAAEAPKEGSAKEARRQLYERSAAVKSYVLARASGICECCGAPAPFKTAKGAPYLEPHHIRRLSDGGPDHPASVAAVCPTCHRRVHYGEDGAERNNQLALKIQALEM